MNLDSTYFPQIPQLPYLGDTGITVASTNWQRIPAIEAI
jgi:hypothetical protein